MVKHWRRMDAKERVGRRMRERIDQLGMTGRQVAKALGKSDAWISSVLSGAQGLQLDDLDGVAEQLRMTPSDLVRRDDSELIEIRPSELRWLKHYREWPQEIQQRWLRILDYFAAIAPDPDGAKLLDRWRDLSPHQRRRLREFLHSLRRGSSLPEVEPFADLPDSDDEEH